MIAANRSFELHTTECCAASSALNEPAIMELLEQIDLATGTGCTAAESTRFLQSTRSLTGNGHAAVEPSAQDLECLRQATFRYRLETGEERITGATLFPVLQRLGYLAGTIAR
jgi:hypothetical protein